MRRQQLLIACSAFISFLCAALSGCGVNDATKQQTYPFYTISAAELAPAALSAGSSATTAVTVSPQEGYTGKVTLSCDITGGGSPSPSCSFSPNPVVITGSGAVTSSLTVSTDTSVPSAAYQISINGSDTNSYAPYKGPASVSMTVKFQHIVILFQENRTPDNLFQDPVLIKAGADIAQEGTNSLGQTVGLTASPLGMDYDLSHQHSSFLSMCDLDPASNSCRMDGADKVPVMCDKGVVGCPSANPHFVYVRPSDVQPYFDLAEQYTFGDRMFQTNQGPSFPAHQFIISGTSEPSPGSNLFASENPAGGSAPQNFTGCTAASNETVAVIDASGSEASHPAIYPCFEHATLTDELDAAGITWRYYTPGAGSIWTAPNAIEHMCGPAHSATCTAPDWVNHVVMYTPQNPAPILTDIAAGQLQQVSWVIPSTPNSDHAGQPNVTGGPSWIASIVNAIGNSPYWQNTAIILTWDDWGGWYDHVSPPKIVNDGVSWGSGYVYGFRVPLVVIAPLAKPHYISHNVHDFGSILKFVEETYDIPSLNFADELADDLSDCFDFTQQPLTFKTINAPLKADFFLNDRRPPSGPDND